MPDLKSHPVWDAGTRWFHWINVLCVVALMAAGLVILNAGSLDISNAGKIKLKTVHASIGYVFAINLIWRFIWAFLGNRYAKLSAVLPGGNGYFHALRSYVVAFFSGHPEQYIGHNPVGRLGAALLFLLITIQAVTGLVLAGTDLFLPPFGHWIAQWVAAPDIAPDTLVPYAPAMYDETAYQSMRAFRKPFAVTHVYNFYFLIATIVLHVAAVIMTDIREGGSIISAMFTGRKTLRGRPIDEDYSSHD
ncbi:MAG: cytochrome b/b6 domain-containing protein [Methylobacter sp.]|uniref:Cytochrome b/b6 domain-containing protein n=1 Tax=Candidatus Methylobacter titanis TaxID=3053457 RepID=A0AA43Q7A1_9GAMM|nr:cytochrome b/b6 domain-containing protein [Candidatus Methylobacter titanis]